MEKSTKVMGAQPTGQEVFYFFTSIWLKKGLFTLAIFTTFTFHSTNLLKGNTSSSTLTFFFKCDLKKFMRAKEKSVFNPFKHLQHTTSFASTSQPKESSGTIFTIDSDESQICPTCNNINSQVSNAWAMGKFMQNGFIALRTPEAGLADSTSTPVEFIPNRQQHLSSTTKWGFSVSYS